MLPDTRSRPRLSFRSLLAVASGAAVLVVGLAVVAGCDRDTAPVASSAQQQGQPVDRATNHLRDARDANASAHAHTQGTATAEPPASAGAAADDRQRMADASPGAGGSMGKPGMLAMGGAADSMGSGGRPMMMDDAMPAMPGRGAVSGGNTGAPGMPGMPGMQGMNDSTGAPGMSEEAMKPMGMMPMMGMCCGGSAAPMEASPDPQAAIAMPGMSPAMGKSTRRPMGREMGAKAQALPGFSGTPHLYHVGSVDFFLDRADVLALSDAQKTALQERKQAALDASTAMQAKIDAAEHRVWALTGSDRPDLGRITTTLDELARLQTVQRLQVIRAVGEAASVLGETQRACLSAWADASETGMLDAASKAPETCPGVGS